jgi:hypothetical protein
MTYEYINAIAAGLIAIWATWCVLSGKVRDGVIGKVLYAIIAISGYAILAGMRHMFMLTYWPRVKRWICRHLQCDHCKPVE